MRMRGLLGGKPSLPGNVQIFGSCGPAEAGCACRMTRRWSGIHPDKNPRCPLPLVCLHSLHLSRWTGTFDAHLCHPATSRLRELHSACCSLDMHVHRLNDSTQAYGCMHASLLSIWMRLKLPWLCLAECNCEQYLGAWSQGCRACRNAQVSQHSKTHSLL